METLNVIYCLRVGFGILAALLAFLLVDLKVGDPLINGATIGLLVYFLTYYVLKWQFMNKVKKPTKILTMGIGAYFLIFIACWVLLITPTLSAPTAAFTVETQTPIVGTPVEFDASLSEDVDGEIVKYLWSFGDDTTIEEEDPNASHYYDIPGDYTVILQVVDDHGITNTNSTTITVEARP